MSTTNTNLKELKKTLANPVVIILIIMCFYFYKKNPDVQPYKPMATNYYSKSVGMARTMNAEVASLSSDSAGNSMYVTNNYIDIAVSNVEKTKDKIDKQLKSVGGKIENLYSSKYYNKTSYNINFKIPVNKLDSFIAFIKEQGKISNQNFSMSEVSEQSNEYKEKLTSLNQRKERLEQLMKTNETNKNSEVILNLERELNSVQEQIAYYEKLVKGVKKDVALASVRLTITPKYYIVYPNGQEWEFKEVINKSVVSFILFTQKLISFAVKVLIFSPYILIAYILGKLFFKRNEK